MGYSGGGLLVQHLIMYRGGWGSILAIDFYNFALPLLGVCIAILILSLGAARHSRLAVWAVAISTILATVYFVVEEFTSVADVHLVQMH
jgi:hypothetical protein